MLDPTRIAREMQVVTSDGEFLGTVGDVDADGITIKRLGGAGSHERIPLDWIGTADQQVVLNRSGAEAMAGWRSAQFAPAETKKDTAPSPAAPTRPNWLIWIAVAVVILLLLMLLL